MLNSSAPQQAENAVAQAFEQARATALRLLARREHSTQELRYKLTGRGYPAALAEQVVAALRDEGLLSEERFAEAYVRTRFERGFGPLRIEAELRERGLPPGLIDSALAGAEFDWSGSARRQRHKRFGRLPVGNFAERARQMRFLQQRGFSGEQLRAALAHEAQSEA